MKLSMIGILSGILLVSSLSLFATGTKDTEDKMIIRVAEQVPNLITPGAWDGQAFSLNSSIYDYLIEMDANSGELVPALATKWSSPDGKIWTFNLRKGVKFHDGSDFTAQDVKFTIERTQDPELGHLKAQDFKSVESVSAKDDFTVVITLKTPLPTFPFIFTDYNMAMLSSDYDYKTLGETAPMGTGPFKMKEMILKESAQLLKNPEYWQEGLPKADELRIYFVPDIESSISLLEAGKVDIVPQVSPIIKKRIDGMEGFNVVSPYQESRFIALSADRAPFSDNKVRLAFKYSMDPEILAKACQGILGEGIFYNETPIVNKLAQYKEIPFRGRDINKARELLKEAGYPDGVTTELFYASDHPYGTAIAQTLKELAAPAGITLELKGFPRDIYLSQYWMDAPMLLTGWGVRVDPSMLLMLAYESEGPWNESHMNDPEADQLIAKIRSEVDAKVRQSYYDRLQEIFVERGTVINLQVPYLVALTDRVQDYRQPLTMLSQLKYAYLK
ncbi:MAG: ABC transporter substrate-binding protein [Spirochaetaceae bacterium]|jgi:peptide/nickel transport system substrate-binding protein|nr:ABC transporter substrate-binding protein [Spirochaetaceae bacterium]